MSQLLYIMGTLAVIAGVGGASVATIFAAVNHAPLVVWIYIASAALAGLWTFAVADILGDTYNGVASLHRRLEVIERRLEKLSKGDSA